MPLSQRASVLAATRSCSHSILVCIQRVLLPASPIDVHVHFQVRSAWLVRGVLQCLPRHSFQLRHATCFRFRHRSCKTLDCFRDVHTVLRQVRTSHGSAPKRCRLLSFKNWTVLNCFCLDHTQFHSRSLDKVALAESKIFQ